MRTLSVRLFVVLLVLSLVATTADAQRRVRRGRAVPVTPGPRFGGHAGYNFDVEELVIGAQLTWPITPRAALYPSFDYYFVDPGSLWSLNLDLKLFPPTRYGAWYVGGGLNYTSNGASDTGLNLLTGLEGRRSRTAPYVEAKFILSDESSFQIVAGFSLR